MEEAINSESCSLIAMHIASGTDVAQRILTILISEAVLYFNVGKTMGPAQIKIVVEMLLNDNILKNLKPEDYKVLFEDMKKGYYGNLYDRFDGQIIFQNAVKYADKRQGLIENESIKISEAFKSNTTIDPAMLPVLKNVLNEIPKEEKKVFDKALVTPIFDKDERSQFIQDSFKEFEKIYNDTPVKSNTGRYVLYPYSGKYNGKPVDQVKFAELRVTEFDIPLKNENQ